MRIALMAGLVVLIVGLTLRADNTPDEQASQHLQKMEQDWITAARQKDIKPLEQMLADDFVLTNPMGELVPRQEFIDKIKDGTFEIKSGEYKDLKVRVYGDAAVVTGRLTLEATWSGSDVGATYAFTDTFIKHDGRWQQVAGHVTRTDQ